MKILYSFNKTGYEADFWTREIARGSEGQDEFIPFNHGEIAPPSKYLRAQQLDDRWFDRDPDLVRLYETLQNTIAREKPDVLLVDNAFPYHPELLRSLPIYRVMRSTDGPVAAYDRDFAYLHAYHQVLHHSPAYSPELSMKEKLEYCGCRNADFWPLGLFDAAWDQSRTEENLFQRPRDIDIIFIGAMHVGKIDLMARIRKALGKRIRMHGLAGWKKNLYFNARYGFPGWVMPARFEEYVPLYQRSKIGINIHNRGKYSIGNYRLFELPANGVLQISDGDEYLADFFDPQTEIVGYRTFDELIDRVRYYLVHDEERERIARAGFRRATGQYRMSRNLAVAAALIEKGMARIDWKPGARSGEELRR